MREIVIPGQEIGEAKPGRLPFGVFREGDKLYSAIYGIMEPEKGLKITPLNGRYIPKPGDVVIGIIVSSKHAGAMVDINAPYLAFLPNPREPVERFKGFSPGDVIVAKVASIGVGEILLGDPRRLIKGKLIEVKPTKIPRIFGRKGSMLQTIKKETGVSIIIGRNGRIWIRGDINSMRKAEKVIRFIEKNAHMYGVTEMVKKMLEGEK